MASLGPSLLLRPSIVMFSSSFLPLEFPFIIVITDVVHRPLPVCRRHLSPPSPVHQYLIVVSSLLSVVHHIIFIVIIMLNIVIIASSSCPPSYWLDCTAHSPMLVGFCLSDIVIALGPSLASTAPNQPSSLSDILFLFSSPPMPSGAPAPLGRRWEKGHVGKSIPCTV